MFSSSQIDQHILVSTSSSGVVLVVARLIIIIARVSMTMFMLAGMSQRQSERNEQRNNTLVGKKTGEC